MLEEVRSVLSEALARLGLVLAADLPGVVAMFIVLAGAFVIAVLFRLALRTGLARVGFDRRAREWGLTSGLDLQPSREPSRLVGAGVFWLVLAAGVALALEVLGASVSSVGLSLLAFLPRLVVGLVILLIGLGVARLAERNVLIGGVNARFRHARVVASGVKWMVIAFASAMALQHVEVGGNLPAIGFAIVVGGMSLAAALAFGLGARDAVARAIERLGRSDAADDGEEPPDRIQHL
jgi:hypothetical protein